MRQTGGDGAAADAAAAERALIDAAVAGDEAAREALVRSHLRDVLQVTSRVLRDRQLAEDAAQDAFVNALAHLRGFRGQASFRTWLLRIAVNAAHTVARRQTRRREVDLATVAHSAPAREDTAASTLARLEAVRVAEALERLPPRQRLTVTLRAQQGLSYREVAEILACTEGAARVNYHLGVKRLKELLA